MKIKICGLTKVEEAEYLNGAGVDYAGFVFYKKSKRNVSVKKASEIMSHLDKGIKKVAVCVSPDRYLLEEIQKADFDIIQIHKALSLDVLYEAKLPIWYAFNVNDNEELAKKQQFFGDLPKELSKKVKGILVDSVDFGSGKTFDWRAANGKTGIKASANVTNSDGKKTKSIFKGREFILAGGLNAGNVATGIKLFDPDIVDVSSGVEGPIGKSETLIYEFVDAVRNAK